LKPRADGLTWACSDLGPDGTHPSDDGRLKVARMLLDFFHSDSTARPWYLAQQTEAAPVVGAVVNAAGYGTALATGSLATIFGSNLAGGTALASTFPLPHELAGTRVEIDGAPALLYYVSPAQINFVIPATGGQSLAVVRGETASAAVKPSIGFWAPGLFTLDSAPGGAVAAEHADGSVITTGNPARRGETIQLFGTGMGIINPALMIPIPAPVVQVGGRQAQITYAGAAPGLPGVTQINLVVPGDAPVGSAAPIVVQSSGSASNTATLAVAAN
jgi:uncharacterized protein (TIGR03437 family)